MSIHQLKKIAVTIVMVLSFIVVPALVGRPNVQAQDFRIQRKLEKFRTPPFNPRSRSYRYSPKRVTGFYDRFGRFHTVGRYKRHGRSVRY